MEENPAPHVLLAGPQSMGWALCWRHLAAALKSTKVPVYAVVTPTVL